MGTGDLNLLKSWNPHLLKNKKKVWETEQELLEENKRFKERQQEIEKERQLQDLTSLTRNGTTKKENLGLDWMYDDPTNSSTQNKDFLLGKRRIDTTTITKNEPHKEEPRRKFQSSHSNIESILEKPKPKPDNAILKDDPLLAFQRANETRTAKHPRRTPTSGKITKQPARKDVTRVRQARSSDTRSSSTKSIKNDLNCDLDY